MSLTCFFAFTMNWIEKLKKEENQTVFVDFWIQYQTEMCIWYFWRNLPLELKEFHHPHSPIEMKWCFLYWFSRFFYKIRVSQHWYPRTSVEQHFDIFFFFFFTENQIHFVHEFQWFSLDFLNGISFAGSDGGQQYGYILEFVTFHSKIVVEMRKNVEIVADCWYHL